MEKLSSYERQQLISVYAIERQDDQQSVIMMIAMLTIGITYVITGTAFLLSHYNRGVLVGIPQWAQLAAPTVTTGIFGFLVVNNASSCVRARHLIRLEHLLKLNVDKADPDKLGSFLPSFRTSTSFIFEPKAKGAELVFLITLLTNYSLCAIVAFGFTALCLVIGPWGFWKIFATIVYVTLNFVELVGLVLPRFSSRFR
jgi:hypothetical protein